jgi:hypothetical protein
MAQKDEIEGNLPTRGGKKHPLTKEDFSQKNSIFLRSKAQFDALVALSDRDNRTRAVIEAMESIEDDVTTRTEDVFRHVYRVIQSFPHLTTPQQPEWAIRR